jgi:hypothetical protein
METQHLGGASMSDMLSGSRPTLVAPLSRIAVIATIKLKRKLSQDLNPKP